MQVIKPVWVWLVEGLEGERMKKLLLILIILIINNCYIKKVKSEILKFPNKKKFSQINKILNLNLKKYLLEIFNKDNPNSDVQSIKNTSFDYHKINFSNPNSDSKNDIIIKANLIATFWKSNTTIFLIYIFNDNKYIEKFKWIGWNAKYDINPKIIDIDLDKSKELIIESDGSGNQSTYLTVSIWKFIDDKFYKIFDEGLNECYSYFPYSYNNEYKFIESKNKKLDIFFTIRTKIDKYNKRYHLEKGYNDKVYKKFGGITNSYIFKFKDKKYYSDKEIIKYQKPFKEFFNK